MEQDEAFRTRLQPASKHILLAEFSRCGIMPETVREFDISYGGGSGFNESVIIPLHDPSGSRIGYATVTDSGSRVMMPETLIAAELLYNCHRAVASGSKQVIVVQDFLDCFRVSQCGFRAVVALLGQSMSEIQEMELVARFRDVVLMFSGDDAGWALTRECVLRLVTQMSVHAAVLPSNRGPRDLSHGDLLASLRYSDIGDLA